MFVDVDRVNHERLRAREARRRQLLDPKVTYRRGSREKVSHLQLLAAKAATAATRPTEGPAG